MSTIEMIDIRPTFTITDPHNELTSGHNSEADSSLSYWKKFIRLAVSSVLPSSEYQRRFVDTDAVDGRDILSSAGGGHFTRDVSVIDYYQEYYDCKPPTLFIPIITIVQLAVFVGYGVAEGGVTATKGGAPLDSPLVFNPARRYEAWRFITYMFLHQGVFHLVFNMLIQLILGIPLEMVHKWHRVMVIYSLGVITGCTMHTVLDRFRLLAGASGGVYALIGAHLAVMVMNKENMTHDWMGVNGRRISSFYVRLAIWIVLVCIDTGVSVYQRYFAEEQSSVGLAAHFGGALAGFLVGVVVIRNLHHRYWEDYIWYGGLALYVVLLIFVVVWNSFYPDYPTMDWRKCCPDPIITKDKIKS